MKFGQYELLGRIAIGAMAEVYRGRVVGAEGFEKYVAIKRILPDLAQDSRFVSMLLTEAKIHSALSHRNIVQIHDLGVADSGEYFIVLEYVDGQNLRAVLDALSQHGLRMDDTLAVHIAHELAQGLQAAHELRAADGQPLGLVHRDVSPSNILISYAGEVKLSDFGLAKRRQDRSLVGSVKGNFAYMAPEQARREPLDRRTDVFALGAVLFEMLIGRRLRTIENEVEGWTQVASGELEQPRDLRPDLEPALDDILCRALAPRREDRFPDAAAMGTALREAAAHMRAAGAAELAWLLRRYCPEDEPRPMMEQTRVIRLDVGAAPASERFAETPPPRARQTPPSRAPLSQRRLNPVNVPTNPGVAPRALPATAAAAVRAQTPPASRAPMSQRRLAPVTAAPSPPAVPAPPPRRRWRRAGVLWIAISALVVMATVVHFAVVPLDVLVVWNRPAWLYLSSDPDGATVVLDGQRLGRATPLRIEVKRDRREHLVEFQLSGYRPTRAALRYDRSAVLSVLAPLQK